MSRPQALLSQPLSSTATSNEVTSNEVTSSEVTSSERLASIPLAIRLSPENLHFPELMDPGAVSELEKRGFRVLPAFRLRGRSDAHFDLELSEGRRLAWHGPIVNHTWRVASPGPIPRLGFGGSIEIPHRCRLSWSEESVLQDSPRFHRFVELLHGEDAPSIPLVVVHKPDPDPAAPTAAVRDYASVAEDRMRPAEFRISFRRHGNEIRPWFDIFDQSLFPPGIEPEPILQTTDRNYALRLVLREGEFVADGASAPRMRWFDANGPLPDQPAHVAKVEIRGKNTLHMVWNEPEVESATAFDVLCRHRGREIWLDPTIYHKGIGPGIRA